MPTQPLPDKLAPIHTALLVIDIQNDFCSPEGLLAKRGRDLSRIEPMIDRLIPFIEIAKQNNILTLYTQQVYDWEKLNERQREQYTLDGRFVNCDIATDGPKFFRINPPREQVFIKYNLNAFSNPNLLETLETNHIKTLIITGVDSEFCIETAVRNAFDLGFKVVVPKDLIANNARKVHREERLLELVETWYGAVTTSEEITLLWQ
ncbi:MAG: cysteine hydrolase family protein [Candidatus Abawacabacteria bacterium]|nr:cysteine hydrolase family protein [Candidatus Abawacabacteria bacterium]